MQRSLQTAAASADVETAAGAIDVEVAADPARERRKVAAAAADAAGEASGEQQ